MTELGARVYSSARAMLDAASAATLGASDVSRGHLRISAPVALTQLCLAPPVAQLLHEHPEAQIELLANDRIVDLVEERIDLAIRVTRLKDSSLIAKRLAFAPICICAAPRYLAAYGKPERPEDLLHHNCLRYALVATRDEWRLQTARSAIELAVHGSFAATSGLIMAGAAKAGIGLAILPRFMVADALRSGELVTLLDEFVPRPLGVYAVRSGRPQTPKLVARLIQLIAAALRVSGFPQTE
jgi:DNA-binding transcriptional LysR family regulator